MSRQKKRITAPQAAKILGTTPENIRLLGKTGILSTIDVNTGEHTTRYYYESEVLARKQASKETITLSKDTESILEQARLLNKEAHASEKEARDRVKNSRNWNARQKRICELTIAAIKSIGIPGKDGELVSPLSEREEKIVTDWIMLEPLENISRIYGLGITRITAIVNKAIGKLARVRRLSTQIQDEYDRNNRLKAENERYQDAIDYLQKKTCNISDDNILVLSEKQYAIRQLLQSDITTLFYSQEGERLKEKGINTVLDLVTASPESLERKGIRVSDYATKLHYRGLYYGMSVAEYGFSDDGTFLRIRETIKENLGKMPAEDALFRTKLLQRIADFGLSVRAYNCLKAAEIKTFADLCSKTRPEIIKCRNLGRKSLHEIEELVEKQGLEFGMDISKYGILPQK